jgi:hypothetical protein
MCGVDVVGPCDVDVDVDCNSLVPRHSMRLFLPLALTCLVLGESREYNTGKAFVPGRKTSQRVAAETTNKIMTKRRLTGTGLSHNLFFRSTDPSPAELSQRNDAIPPRVLNELASANVSFPYDFEVTNINTNKASISIRLLQANDLAQITDLCVAEYGSESSLESLLKTPSGSAIMEYLDSLSLRALVDITMRMKLTKPSSTTMTNSIPSDHAVLVACQSDGAIVGMVEVSRQPPLADRNPPPVPIPLWFKQLYSLAMGAGETQGWCTNLLVAPRYRGKSYSKVLMAAVEGVARSWKCQSVHLHADADRWDLPH